MTEGPPVRRPLACGRCALSRITLALKKAPATRLELISAAGSRGYEATRRVGAFTAGRASMEPRTAKPDYAANWLRKHVPDDSAGTDTMLTSYGSQSITVRTGGELLVSSLKA